MNADGSVFAGTNGNGAVIWRPLENRRLVTRGWQSDVRTCDVSPDGRWVATGSGELLQGAGAKVWEAATGKLVAELPLGRMSPVWFSPDGKWLVSGGAGFRLWSVDSWREGPSLGGTEQSNACAFTHDGRLLALADQPGVVRLIEPDTGRELARLTAPVETRLWPKCFSPDGGKLITVGSDSKALHVFDLYRIRSGLRELNFDWQAGVQGGAYLPKATKSPDRLTLRVDTGNFLPDLAIDRLRQAAQANPKNAEAHNNLAWLLLTGPEKLRDPMEALPHAQKADEPSGGRPIFKNTFGVALYRNGKYQEAVPVLEKSLEGSNGETDAFDLFFLAMCHHRLGESAKAKECFDRATRWFADRREQLSQPQWLDELTAFQEEAHALLAGPAAGKK